MTNPSGREHRGRKFGLFIEESVKLSEMYNKEIAVTIARDKYNTYRTSANTLASTLNLESNFPEWNQTMWEDYFYNIAPTEACIQRTRLKRSREIEEASYIVFKKCNQLVNNAISIGDSETLKNVGSTMSNASSNYKALFLNRK